MQPLVSILTTAYNSEKFIDTYIKKILEMNYSNVEIIFVDDGSSDNTKDVLDREIKKIEDKGYSFLYLYQENGGQASALNTALKYIKGEYFTILDIDDFLYEDCLKKRIEILEKNKKLGFVISNGDNYYPSGKGTQIYNNISRKNFFEKIIDGYYICNLAYTFRTEIFRHLNPEMSIAEYRAGQNIQIIAPYAMYSEFRYIDESLFGRYNSSDSHSQKVVTQSYGERVLRENEILKIYIETLYKNEEGIGWIAPIAVKTMFRKMNVAYVYNQKSDVKNILKTIKTIYKVLIRQLFSGFILLIKLKLKYRLKK